MPHDRTNSRVGLLFSVQCQSMMPTGTEPVHKARGARTSSTKKGESEFGGGLQFQSELDLKQSYSLLRHDMTFPHPRLTSSSPSSDRLVCFICSSPRAFAKETEVVVTRKEEEKEEEEVVVMEKEEDQDQEALVNTLNLTKTYSINRDTLHFWPLSPDRQSCNREWEGVRARAGERLTKIEIAEGIFGSIAASPGYPEPHTCAPARRRRRCKKRTMTQK